VAARKKKGYPVLAKVLQAEEETDHCGDKNEDTCGGDLDPRNKQQSLWLQFSLPQ
jgi:hypothetical protein